MCTVRTPVCQRLQKASDKQEAARLRDLLAAVVVIHRHVLEQPESRRESRLILILHGQLPALALDPAEQALVTLLQARGQRVHDVQPDLQGGSHDRMVL
jgi:hypothetical protein